MRPAIRFSITIGLPSRSDNHWPTKRATMSVVPPGVNGTIKWIGRVGYTCALAICERPESTLILAANRRNLRRGRLMAMPRELRHAINHIEQRLECLLLAQSG